VTNLTTWDIAPENPTVNGPVTAERAPVEKFYFMGQTNATGHVESIMMLGSNAPCPVSAVGSSATSGLYAGIVMRQCERVGTYFENELHKIEWEGDDRNTDVIINRLSDAIDLVGEPALAAACRELMSHTKYRFRMDKLLQAVAAAKDNTTEIYRARVLEQFCHASDPQLRYAAVDALGNMAAHSSAAKEFLKNVRKGESNMQIASLAELYIR
jgi:hypothetical protein